jgi:glycosyltransferase involved in cell wall biosynthesis
MKKQIENLIVQNNTAEAKKILFNAINNSNDDPNLYLLLGSCYAFESNFELTVQYYNKAFELAPNDYEVISTICNFLIANNCKSEAQEIMNNFLSKQPQENIQHKESFDYLDFIVNDGDAVNYNPSNTNISNGLQPIVEPFIAEPSYTGGFSYEDLIFNDVNDVLEQHNLEKIEAKHNFPISSKSNNSDVLEQHNLEKIEAKHNIAPTTSGNETSSAVHKNNNIKPKMLFVTFGWNESGGGVAVPREIIKEFAKRGYEVYVFYAALNHSSIYTPYYLEKIEYSGVKLYGLFNRPAPLYDFDNPMREIYDENVVKIFKQVLDEVKPNIVNIHNLHGLTLEIASIVKRCGIVSTFTTHNYHLIDPKVYMFDNNLMAWKDTDFLKNSDLPARFPHLKEAYKKRIDKCREIILNDIDYIFAVSNRVRDLFIEFISKNNNGQSIVENTNFKEIASKKICVMNQVLSSVNTFIENPIRRINNGLQSIVENGMPIAENKIRFAFIGDGLPQKGVHLIAQALQFIPNKNFTIDIYGRYLENTDYGRAIKQIDKNNNITIRGEYSPNDLRKIGENTDVMLFTSVWEEAQGMVLAEALAMNIPVIASKIGGVEDTIIDGYNGYTYIASNPKSLASVMNMLIENPYKVNELSSRARLPYTFNDYIDNLEDAIIRLVNGERPDASEFNLSFRDRLLNE